MRKYSKCTYLLSRESRLKLLLHYAVNVRSYSYIIRTGSRVPPNPHEILTRWSDLKIDTHLINVLGLSLKMANDEDFQL